jgi:group II intron reverse transcriptase/maturase
MTSNNDSELWKSLPWKKLRKNLFRLQCRLWKAVRVGDRKRTNNLQKPILKSRSARLLAIRQVTQLNKGKKTAGVDGKASLTFKERFDLDNLLKTQVNTWTHNKLREIPIPKKDGTMRVLKVPTMKDRAWQCIIKYAIEPAHEAIFHERSYGFRPGRSAHDVQKYLFDNLRSKSNGQDKIILEMDIEKCFDRINHNHLMSQIIAPKSAKLGLWKCLKVGVNPEFPEQGTPQGGVCSPVLANIALHGIEAIHKVSEIRR